MLVENVNVSSTNPESGPDGFDGVVVSSGIDLQNSFDGYFYVGNLGQTDFFAVPGGKRRVSLCLGRICSKSRL